MVCVICQNEISVADKDIFITNCVHKFHRTCWDNYLNHQHEQVLCPICKTSQNERITIVVASSPVLVYDDVENDEIRNTCTCSKYLFIIILMLVIILIIILSFVISVFLVKNT